LEDQVTADSTDMSDEKASKAAAEQAKATAERDLGMTSKELTNGQEQLAMAVSSCMQVGADHEKTVAARTEELRVIAEAKSILAKTTSGAESQTYALVQVQSSLRTKKDLAGAEVVQSLKRLAKEQHSAALAQLVSRVATVFRFSATSGDDPFQKVKGLISEMIARLQKEAGAEAAEKAYCDEQMMKTEAKKGELADDIARMTSRIDRAVARSTQLKGEVRVLEGELGALATAQAQMDAIRQETNADYKQAKADLELGLSGVREALTLLRNYYGGASAMLQDEAKFGAFMQQPAAPELHSQAGGAGGSIINILEVVESDFAKNLAKEELEEADAQSEYEKISQENAVTKTTKEQDVRYKLQESKAADTTAAEYSADRETTYAEQSAVLAYYSKIRARCIAKPDTYENRSTRRAAEIKGLKEALSILEDETAFVQRRKRASFLGMRSH